MLFENWLNNRAFCFILSSSAIGCNSNMYPFTKIIQFIIFWWQNIFKNNKLIKNFKRAPFTYFHKLIYYQQQRGRKTSLFHFNLT